MPPTKEDISAAKMFNIPPQVYLALKKDAKKVELLKTVLTENVEQDIKNTPSFLFSKYSKHRNIDPFTGKDVDPGIPYYYKSELLHGDTRRIYAVAKVLFGLTGSSFVFDSLEMNRLSQRAIAVIAKYIQEELSKAIARVQLEVAVAALDPSRTKDLMRGVFYVSPKIKHIEDLRGLRFLQVNEVVIPLGVTVIRAHAFESVPLKRVVIPKTVSIIEDYAFRGCQMEELKLPSNKYLTILGAKAFSQNKIKNLVLPDNFNSFDFLWFEENPLEEISAPEKLKIYNRKPNVKVKFRTIIKKGAPAPVQQ